MHSTSKIVAALLFAFVSIGVAFGQGSASGDLHVIVKDEKGSVVTSATVTAREQAKATVRATTSNTDGEYRLVSLPPGVYTITVEAPGFAKAEAKDQTLTVTGTILQAAFQNSLAGVYTGTMSVTVAP